MARLKLYYPIDEITTNLYTLGQELMTLENVEYIGSFHRYTTGEVYTGATWDAKTSKQLIAYAKQTNDVNTIYKVLKPEIRLKYSTPYASAPAPTKQEITAGSMFRYFIKQLNNDNILEIDQNQYATWQNNGIDKKIYQAVQLTWYISGEINDVVAGGVTVPGVQTKNKKQIQYASQTIPGIGLVLNNLLEYYTDADYSTPVDINGLNS
jgi:hypothetical protein